MSRQFAQIFIGFQLAGLACNGPSAEDILERHPVVTQTSALVGTREPPDRSPAFPETMADVIAPYPPGRWRLAPPRQLGTVMLWFSHILIRYEGVPVLQSYFGFSKLSSELPAKRSRQTALELARNVATEAQSDPQAFAEMATRYSEDRATKDLGGSIGAVLGSSLREWPQVLDAFAELRIGEVSKVVETEYGFHIFLRCAPPQESQLSGTHIVVGYDEAPWLDELLTRGTISKRSRSEAVDLAGSIYREALLQPDRFVALVSKYSEHRDAAFDGDMGSWSTRELGPYSRQFEVLATLPVGGISRPIETIFGFEILQRAEERPRSRYVVEALTLPFDPTAGGSSKVRASQEAEKLAEVLALEPLRFEELVKQYCCAGPQQWTDGQDSSPLALATRNLEIGQVARKPIESDFSYVIPRRLDPNSFWRAAPPLVFDLPAPSALDVVYFLTHRRRAILQQEMEAMAKRVAKDSGLDPIASKALVDLSQLPGDLSDDMPIEQRREAILRCLAGIETALGTERYERYIALWSGFYERELMGQGRRER